jgi:hypothetical protein
MKKTKLQTHNIHIIKLQQLGLTTITTTTAAKLKVIQNRVEVGTPVSL